MQDFRTVPSVQALPAEGLRKICEMLIATKTPTTVNRDDGESDDDYVGLHAVLSLARTSRVLHEYAANALWETIPSFGILVYTLPQDIWSSEPLGLGDDEDPGAGPLDLAMNLKRPLVEADFVRFTRYAPRVKRILLPADCTQFPPRTRSLIFSPNILDAFESHPYGRVLPNLRVLRSSPALPYYADFYRSFPVLFGPNVQEVFTRCPYVNPIVPEVDEGHYKWMLTKLHVIAPNLYTLVLNVNSQASLASAHAPILSSVAVNTSERLCAFHVGDMAINLYALRHLAELPSLMILGIKLDDAITAPDLAFLREPGKTYFPRLQGLHLGHSRDLSLLSLFVEHVQPTCTHLKNIDLDNREGAHTIEVISLDCWVYPESPGPHVLTEDHLRPFFALRQLTCFNLNVRCEFDINNATLERVAAAWPKLTVLGLGPAHEATTSKVTLDGLIPLARGCLRLKRLGLTIDAAVPMEAPIDLNGPCGSWLLHGPAANVDLAMLPNPRIVTPKHFQRKPLDDSENPLEELRLGRSPIRDPAAVAGFLSCFFPKLKTVHGQWRPMELLDPEFLDGDPHLDWSEEEVREIIAEAEWEAAWHWAVETVLPEIRQIRKGERKACGPASMGIGEWTASGV
ncbi:hypothetical protein LXA43DRAFT_1110108 [Ganoderma leucocontextum]|nr:hypothetical protein LXA43DRAFT_1110108 [Ganoderma leucocontextum]